MSYGKHRLTQMIRDAKEAMAAAGVIDGRNSIADTMAPAVFDQQAIAQLVLAQAICDSGNTVSDSIDKLEKVAVELGGIAYEIKHSG